MSTQFYSVHPGTVQNGMGGTYMHTPQSIFQPTMNHQNIHQQNETQWLKMPEIPPMTMPWVAVPSSQQPDLIRTFNCVPENHDRFARKKRMHEMLTPDIVDIRPRKQLITEEKMAQHFQDLRISSNATGAQPSVPSTSSASECQSTTQPCDIDADLSNTLEVDESDSTPKLILSDELKRLQQEPILPSSLLSKLERPTMALVLWEPPSKHLRLLPTLREPPTVNPSSDDNNNGMNVEPTGNNNSNNNNNNESIPDLNQSMDVNIIDATLEPMDL